MVHMTHRDLNDHAFTESAENFKKLLIAYGDSEAAVQTMQDAVDGYRLTGDGQVVKRYGQPVEKAKKNNILADFRANMGDFAPKPAAPTADALDEFRQTVAALTERVKQLE